MGADYIGWIGCPLQDELQPEGFLGKLKLRSYKQVVEERVPADKREGIKVRVVVSDREPRQLTYSGIVAELGQFSEGIPQCRECPINSGGAPVGCYRYVTYPVDAAFEELVFDLFADTVEIEDSICYQIYRDVISNLSRWGSPWRDRGEDGSMAELDEPLVYSWGSFLRKKRIDSAQILEALFITLDSPELLVAYAALFGEVLARAEEQGLTDDESRTLAEFREVTRMLQLTAPIALTEGAEVLVDS